MKFASFLTPAGQASYGAVVGAYVVDLGVVRPALPSLKDFLASEEFNASNWELSGPHYALSAITYLPVIPNPGKIICVGLNYKDHIKETGRNDSAHPSLFLRLASSQIGHGAAMIKPKVSDRFDYEGELALIIGKPGRHVAAENALEHVAGYACYNDGSVRDWQRHTHQFTPGKNFDGTGSFGPWMATPDEMGARENTWLITRLNGQEVQKASLDLMVFSIEEQIAYISTFTKLETGDVIVTGTPGGVGDRRTPPLYMVAGDKVEVEITGVGVLQNIVANEV